MTTYHSPRSPSGRRHSAKPPPDMTPLRIAMLPLLILFCALPPIGFAKFAWNDSQISIITSAAKQGDLIKVKAMIKTDKKFAEVKGYLGRTPLWWAAAAGQTAVIDYLIKETGVNKEAADDSGWTPLFAAAARNKKDALEALIDQGADRQAVDTSGGTALHAAATGYNPDTAGVLADLGVKVDAQDKAGMTPLHIAVQHKEAVMVTTLLGELHANPNIKAKDGSTPLRLANQLHRGQYIVDELLKAGGEE